MAESISQSFFEINKWVYRYFSKKEPVKPEQKVAWISSFCPVELFEVFDIAYVYPESYAAVTAASGKEQACLEYSRSQGLSLDCCSYSTCFNGCIGIGGGPRGMPPKPDILIAANNQCNTLPNWWNLMAEQWHVPLFIIDYPGEYNAGSQTRTYVDTQHRELVKVLSALTGKSLDLERLSQLINTSRKNIHLWKKITALLADHDMSVSALFDRISPLIVARCLPVTSSFFTLLAEDYDKTERDPYVKKLYWLGYPFWYQGGRVLPETESQVVGADYLSWWNLNYDGDDVWEQLYNAYNFTFLNLTAKSKNKILLEDIHRSRAQALIINHNKSCKRDFSTFYNEYNDYSVLPYLAIESDMIDRNYLNKTAVQDRINTFLNIIDNASP
ncbi:2-hydroxyglutaryl-CoA dehydratase [Spirochaetia bacterium]|nr:2-hydroxyglutaryl-CoA dehydratase [Spirochaetia bacterium]